MPRQRRRPPTKPTISELVKPRFPFYDRYRIEQVIKTLHERDELPEEPSALEILTENVIRKVYSRTLQHDGTKWVTVPFVPTDVEHFSLDSYSIGADKTKRIGFYEGRGASVGLALKADYAKMDFTLRADGRPVIKTTLSDVWDLYKDNMIPNIGGITIWNTTGNVYCFMSSRREPFARSIEYTVHNPDTTEAHTITAILEVLGLQVKY